MIGAARTEAAAQLGVSAHNSDFPLRRPSREHLVAPLMSRTWIEECFRPSAGDCFVWRQRYLAARLAAPSSSGESPEARVRSSDNLASLWYEYRAAGGTFRLGLCWAPCVEFRRAAACAINRLRIQRRDVYSTIRRSETPVNQGFSRRLHAD
jgi:hypothetical protein